MLLNMRHQAKWWSKVTYITTATHMVQDHLSLDPCWIVPAPTLFS